MNARVETPAPGEAKPVNVTAGDVAVGKAKPEGKRRGGKRIALMISVPIVLAAIGGYMWLTGGRYVDTDNAYVQQTKVALSADVAGRIVEVHVHDNQPVKAGDVVFKIDPAPYEIALSEAQAALAGARMNVEQLRVAYETAKAKLAAAQSTLDIRKRELDRNDSLAGKGFQTQAGLDDVRLSVQQAQSDVDLARQGVDAAAAALDGNPEIETDQFPAVLTALAAVDTAKRNLAKTVVTAPADGIVTQVSNLNVGQFVAMGTAIASLVETSDTWVEANFKETQLTNLKAGQPAEVTVDAYPGVALEGHVQSIGAATGSEFSLIPAQNATGNWVKVTQRIPVRIHLDSTANHDLRAGMSAVVTIDTKPQATSGVSPTAGKAS